MISEYDEYAVSEPFRISPVRCSLCGEPAENGKDWCDNCIALIHEFFDPEIERIHKNFGYRKEDIIEAIKWLY